MQPLVVSMEKLSRFFTQITGNSRRATPQFPDMSDYLNNLFGLEGKVAVIIGGTGELCGTMAEGLASAGAEVVLVGRDEEKAEKRLEAIRKAGGNGYFAYGEVVKRDSLNDLLDSVIEQSDRCDILVNGAGVNSPTPFLEITDEELHRILDINLAGLIRACQVFGNYFLSRDVPGSIINLGSISGLNPLSRVFSYSASKAAVHNLTRNLAREWADRDIRVNTLVPGFFPAEQNRAVLNESRVAEILRHTPASRFGNPQELIGATLLLASNQAGGFITGTEMIVDGGFQAMTI